MCFDLKLLSYEHPSKEQIASTDIWPRCKLDNSFIHFYFSFELVKSKFCDFYLQFYSMCVNHVMHFICAAGHKAACIWAIWNMLNGSDREWKNVMAMTKSHKFRMWNSYVCVMDENLVNKNTATRLNRAHNTEKGSSARCVECGGRE